MRAARQPLFDKCERTDRSPAAHQESNFAFYNRVGGDYWEHPRALMQQWLDHVESDTDYTDLRQRFRSRDDEQFRSAFLELYLHESLLRAGHTVTIHPPLDGSTSRPDFLAQRGEDRMFVEAITPGTTPGEKAAAQRLAVLFDTVNRLDDPNFMLLVEELVEGADPPGAARLRADLRRWLSRLAPDVPWDLATAPVYRWGRQGWSITFRAIPLAPDKRGLRPNHRAIGVYGHAPVQFIDHAPAIRKAVMSKHHQYGDLDAPFVVAVGTYIHETDRWHTTNAMYGALAFQLGRDATGETVTRPFRCDDGYFGAPPQWQHRNVSGVLIVNQLMPSHVQRADVAMWRHPDPLHPLPQNLGLPAHNLTPATDGTLNDTPPAPTAEEFFGLPSPWPPGEPWPR